MSTITEKKERLDLVPVNTWVGLENRAYGVAFVSQAKQDKHGGDLGVITGTTGAGKGERSLWKFYREEYGSEIVYFIENKKYGFMFAASTDKKGDDHIVECDPEIKDLALAKAKYDENYKWGWGIKELDGEAFNLEIHNRKYGTLFAATTDRSGDDHLVEVTKEGVPATGVYKRMWIVK